jgi:mono/diheme cytochrome c family protein
MKKFFKILIWAISGLILVMVVLVGYVQLNWNRKFDAPYPAIKASTDPVLIERGKYLAFGPSHCAVCHVPMDKIRDVDNGLQIPLSGGWEESFPGFGTFRAPNLTPDPETGIGKLTDEEIARTVRYGVKSTGHLLAPFMEFQGMSDEDLTAVISFLRSQEPVKHKVEPSELSFVAKALVAFGLLKPEGPENTPPRSVVRDSTAVYGKYLANNLGNCRSCHNAMDNMGKQIGPDFAGGGIFPPGAFSEGNTFVSPNLTPDEKTGAIALWDEATFVNRFRGGRLYQGSPMPWGVFSRMDESDLKAIYRYLHSLDPVEHKVEKTVYAPGEELPKINQ